MIKAIIFDLDGVVVNSEPVHQRLEDEMYKELGLEIPEDLKKSIVGTSSVDAWNMIKQRFSLAKTPEELLQLGRGRYLEVVRRGEVPLSAGILDVINSFLENNYKILLASSATSRTIQEVLKWHNLEEIFKINIGGDQVKKSKPDPEIFLKVAQMAEMKPVECLVIEDAGNGVKAAKKAGMYCIGFQNEFTGDQDLSMADVVVNRLHEITIDLILEIDGRKGGA